MKFLKNILIWLGLGERDSERGENPFLTPPDVESIKAQLKVVENARRHGSAGIPAPSATQLMDVEESIRVELEGERHKVLVWAEGRIVTIHARLNSVDITKDVNRLNLLADEFEREADTLLNDQDAHLNRLAAAARKREAELERFRQDNNLERDAVLPSGLRHFILGCILLVVLAVEGSLNGLFFSASFDGGFVDGVLLALCLATVNVVVCFVVGRVLFPFVHHDKSAFRLIGFTGLLVAGAGTAAMGLVTSHLRDALARGANISTADATHTAWETLRHSTFEFADIMSFILFGMTIVFGLCAFIEGYSWTDRYPGYARYQRRRDEAVDEFEEELEDVSEQLQASKDDYLATLERDVKACSERIIAFRSHIEDKRNVRPRLVSGLDKAEGILTALIQCYRNENEMERNGLPVPSYFQQKVPLNPVQTPDYNTTDEEARLEIQASKLSELLDNLEPIRRRIQASFIQNYNKLTPLKHQVGE